MDLEYPSACSLFPVPLLFSVCSRAFLLPLFPFVLNPLTLYHPPVGLVSQQLVQGEPTIAQLMRLLGFA